MSSAGGNRCSRSRRARDRQSGSALRSAVSRSTFRASGLRYAAREDGASREVSGSTRNAAGSRVSNRSPARDHPRAQIEVVAVRWAISVLRPHPRRSADPTGGGGRRATADRRCRGGARRGASRPAAAHAPGKECGRRARLRAKSTPRRVEDALATADRQRAPGWQSSSGDRTRIDGRFGPGGRGAAGG